MITIQFLNQSFIRLKPLLLNELPNSDFCEIDKGSIINIKAYKPDIGLFIRVTFDTLFKGKNTWLVYSPDIKMEGNEPDNKPNDTNVGNEKKRTLIKVPGNTSVFYASQPIIPKGNFTWGEATHGGTRPIQTVAVANGILRVAKSLELVRSKLGNVPIKINSWYRDPATNAAVGGASQSRHLSGDAVDFVIDGVDPYHIFDRLDSWWGDRGGLASASCFTHLDCRGYEARWDYGY